MKLKMTLDQVVNAESGWFTLSKDSEKKHLDIYLYGVIGSYRVNAQQFLDDIQAAGEVSTINLYLNTFGGGFYDGLAIYNTLKQHSAQVTVKVMGYALSMGSVIMLAGDRIEAAENSLIMIHRANAGVRGNVDDLQKAISILLKHEEAIIPEYKRRLGVDDSAVKTLLSDETWYTAKEAKAAGLVDYVMGEVEIDKDASGMTAENLRFVNENFKKIPDALSAVAAQSVSQRNTPLAGASVQDVATEVVKLLKAGASDEVEQLKKECAALKEQVAELSQPDPSKNTPPFENLGPVEDSAEAAFQDFV